jgi:hypothetical protein
MARSRVSFLVGTVALVVAVLAMPGRLEGQSTGVLQTTVRVVDYSSSLAALKAAQSAYAPAAQLHHVAKSEFFALPVVEAVALPVKHPNAELTSEPLVVTISYLR